VLNGKILIQIWNRVLIRSLSKILKIQPLDQKKKYSFKKRQEHPQNLMQFLIIHFFDKTGTEIPQSCHIEYIEAKSFMQSLF
jgi:hypothetical protein